MYDILLLILVILEWLYLQQGYGVYQKKDITNLSCIAIIFIIGAIISMLLAIFNISYVGEY